MSNEIFGWFPFYIFYSIFRYIRWLSLYDVVHQPRITCTTFPRQSQRRQQVGGIQRLVSKQKIGICENMRIIWPICDFKGTFSPFLSAVIRKFLHGQSHSSLGNRFNIFGRASRTTAKRNKVIWVVVESVFTFGNFCCQSFGKSGNKQHLHPWTFFLKSREWKKKILVE